MTAIKKGAYSYLTKPFDPKELLLKVRNALEKRRLAFQVKNLKTLVEEKYGFANIVGRSEKMIRIFEQIAQIARTDFTVRIFGESGTGKELVAKAIHCHSLRQNAPVHRRELRRPARNAPRKRALRTRKGRLHGRPAIPEGTVRAGRQGDDLSRRDLRDAALAPGQASAGASGTGIQARRERADPEGRRPGHRGDEQGPQEGGRGREIPGGPLSTGSRSSPWTCPRSASARRTFPSSSNIS